MYIDKIDYHKDIIQLKLIGLNNITNFSHMFDECIELVSIFEKTNLNILKPENISNNIISEYDLSLYEEIEVKNTNIHDDIDFYKGCNQPLLSLSISTISKKNNSDFTDFTDCDDEFILDDIVSSLKFSNIINMSYMFNKCYSLISVPDISEWNITNTIYMNNMFSSCLSLKSIPDISKWNTSNT